MRPKRTPKSRDLFDRSHSDELNLADAPESDLSSFGDTATRGFSDAWDDADALDNDDDVSQFGSDPDDNAGRDLDTRSKRTLVALVLIAVIGGAIGYGIQSGRFAQSTPADDAASEAPELLLSPDAVRIYEAEPTTIEVDLSASATGLFQATSDGLETIDTTSVEPIVGFDLGAVPETAAASPVLWAGRMHVAIFADGIGEGLENGDLCAVVSLVTDQLVGIDVAAHGACDPAFDATGDRLACLGADLALIEVWSGDPSSLAVPTPVSFVRFRVQGPGTSTEGVDAVLSRRGSLALTNGRELIDVAATLGGAPGDTVAISSVDSVFGGSCTLIDRADVEVKLLPS